MNPIAQYPTAGIDAAKSKGIMFFAVAAVALLSLVFGLAAVTAEPVVVAMAAALVVGAVLLLNPKWIIDTVFVTGLVVSGLITIWVEGMGSKAVWGISLLSFMLMLLAIFRMVTVPRVARGTPGFVWAALGFMMLALVSSLLQLNTPYETLSGFKRYFQGFGILFAFAWLVVGQQDIRRWLWLLLAVALIQLPWAIYQRSVLMPIRESLQHLDPFMVPFDVIAGTFGASMLRGGANAEMAAFLIITLAFLLARWREKLIRMSRIALAAPFLLIPLFLGETKIVLLVLPLTLLILFRREVLSRPHVAAAALLAGTVITIGAGYAYTVLNKLSLEEQIQETLSYNFGDKGHGSLHLNRTKVLTFWAEHQGMENPISPVFGNGLGSAHDAAGGHIARQYPGYGISLTGAALLLWEQGLAGTFLFILMIYLAWRAAGQLLRTTSMPLLRADAAAIEAVMPLFAIFIFFRSTLFEVLSFQIVFAAILGYLAWMIRYDATDGMRRT